LGLGGQAKVMEPHKERIDSVVYFAIWRAFAPLPQRHLCALPTTMEHAGWKHFQVEIEQFNKKRLMNHINLYVPKKCLGQK